MRRFAAAVLAVAATVPVFALQDAKQEPKESRTAYIRRIFEKDRTSYGDACRASLSLVTGQHSDADFAALQADLAGRSIVDPGWGLQEKSPLTKGTLAYMLCKSLGIRGGLTATILGMNRRYALREAIHVGLIAGGTTDEHVTGREFIDVVTNAEIYKEEGNLDSVRK